MKRKLLAALGAILAAAIIYCIVPPAHRAAAQYTDQETAGGTSTGSANAQAITIYNYDQHAQLVPLRFIPGFTNTGPATIAVTGLAPVEILRPSSIGLVALSGQELLAGEPTSIVYNGANYVLSSNVDMTPIGGTVEVRGGAAPRGTLIEDGSCVSTTTYAALNAVIGGIYGSCSTGFFKLPRSNGTAFVAYDGQGVNGAANLITQACGSPNSPVICGNDLATLTAALVPTITSTGNNNITVTPQVAPSGVVPVETNVVFNGAFQSASAGTSGSFIAATNSGGWGSTNTFTGSNPITVASSGTGGSAPTHPVENPILPGIRAIKY